MLCSLRRNNCNFDRNELNIVTINLVINDFSRVYIWHNSIVQPFHKVEWYGVKLQSSNVRVLVWLFANIICYLSLLSAFANILKGKYIIHFNDKQSNIMLNCKCKRTRTLDFEFTRNINDNYDK